MVYVSRNVSPDILLAIAEVKGYLRAMRGLLGALRNPRHPIKSPASPAFAAFVSLNRELAKGHEGNSLIVDNAELLKAQPISSSLDDITNHIILENIMFSTVPFYACNPDFREALRVGAAEYQGYQVALRQGLPDAHQQPP